MFQLFNNFQPGKANNAGQAAENRTYNQNAANNFSNNVKQNSGFGGANKNALSNIFNLLNQLLQQLQSQHGQNQSAGNNTQNSQAGNQGNMGTSASNGNSMAQGQNAQNNQSNSNAGIPQSTQDAFNGLTGGSDTLTSKQLVGAVNGVAGKDGAFDSGEFQKLGGALGLNAEQSSNVFNALSNGSGSIPASAVIDFASQKADANGNWNINQFNDVVSSLPGLNAGQSGGAAQNGSNAAPANNSGASQNNTANIPQSTQDAFNGLTGGSDTLTSEQLVGAVNGVAGKDHAFDSGEFQTLGGALGLNAEQSSNVFNALSNGSGSIPASAVIDFASQKADANGNWNLNQFNDVVSSLPGLNAGQSGGDAAANSSNAPGGNSASSNIPQSTQDAFNGLTGGSDTLTSEQLVGAVNGVAGKDHAFDSGEFQTLGGALGLNAEQSSNVFNALSNGSGSIPASAVIDFASQRADANGNWNINQFNDVVSSLPGLNQDNTGGKY